MPCQIAESQSANSVSNNNSKCSKAGCYNCHFTTNKAKGITGIQLKRIKCIALKAVTVNCIKCAPLKQL